MEPKLTQDFAHSVELSINPFTRHQQVSAMLKDPAIVGEGIRIEPNFPTVLSRQGEVVVGIYTVLPLLGRRALKRAAATLEFLNNQGE